MKRFLLPITFLVLASTLTRAGSVTPSQRESLAGQMDEAYLLTIDRSLVERERERIEAQTAFPEASPAPAPFSLRPPEAFVSSDLAAESLTLDPDLVLGNAPESANWALVGLGSAFLVFVLPGRGGKFTTRKTNLPRPIL